MDTEENPFGAPPRKVILSTLKGVMWGAVGMGVLIGAGVVGVASVEAKKLDAAFQFTGQETTKQYADASIAAFGPFQEDATARTIIVAQTVAATPSSLQPTASLSNIAPSLAALRTNAAQIDAAIETCKRQSPDCLPEVRQYQDMIEKVQQIPDRLTQAKTINGWVNTAILYDQGMLARARAHQPYTWSTALGALVKGSGVCDHQAELKLHALSKVGFKQDDLRFTVLMILDEGKWVTGHAAVLTRINGQNYVLNNQSTTEDVTPFHQTYLPLEKTSRTLDFNAALQTTAQALNLGLDAPYRQNGLSMIPLYAMNYRSAQPYVGVIDSDKPPYYRGAKIDRPLMVGQTTESLGENLSQVAAPYRPVVFAALDQAVNRYVGTATPPRQDTITMPPMVIRAHPSFNKQQHKPAF